jgi:hypothetical protein
MTDTEPADGEPVSSGCDVAYRWSTATPMTDVHVHSYVYVTGGAVRGPAPAPRLERVGAGCNRGWRG